MLEQNNFPSIVIDNSDLDPAMLIDDNDIMQDPETAKELRDDVEASRSRLNEWFIDNHLSRANANKLWEDVRNAFTGKSITYSFPVASDSNSMVKSVGEIKELPMRTVYRPDNYFDVIVDNPLGKSVCVTFDKAGSSGYKNPHIHLSSLPENSSVEYLEFVSKAMKDIVKIVEGIEK